MSTPIDGRVQPIAAVLQQMHGGKTHAELSDALAVLVGAVTDTGRKGKLVLTLVVEPDDSDVPGVKITPQTATTLPKIPVRPAKFFLDADGALTRDYPGQQSIPLAAVDSGEGSTQKGIAQ